MTLLLGSAPPRDPALLRLLRGRVVRSFARDVGIDPSPAEEQALLAICCLAGDSASGTVEARVQALTSNTPFLMALAGGSTLDLAKALLGMGPVVLRVTVDGATREKTLTSPVDLAKALAFTASVIAHLMGESLALRAPVQVSTSGASALSGPGSLGEFSTGGDMAGAAATTAGVVAVGTLGIVAFLASLLVPVAIVGGIGYLVWNKHKENKAKGG